MEEVTKEVTEKTKEKVQFPVIYNEKELLKFLANYDYICEKYEINIDHNDYAEIAKCERKWNLTDVVKRDYGSVYENIRLVYGDEGKANRMLHIYKHIKEKVVNQFLNIPGLERLFDEKFFEFEWDMHSRMDFENHDISFYRDHFIHQVRNFFEMTELLNNEDIYNDFKEQFVNGDNKVSQYVKNGIARILSNGEDGVNSVIRHKDYKKDVYVINYIIKASVALCSLFHDIGYPVEHFSKLHRRISGFMPSMYMFLGDDAKNFEHIYALLFNSLLFRVVGKEELRKEICSDKNHGAVSAVGFLLTFYETGVIGQVCEEQKIAIEVAAVAIYNHTLKYEILGENGSDYYAPKYKLNPLAYLLRICDDIQEWDRTYFEIQQIPDMMVCRNCGSVVKRKKREYGNILPSRYDYVCNCDGRLVFRKDDYKRRKIIDVVNCRDVIVSRNENLLDKSYALMFRFDYDLALLLKMCSIAHKYSKHRVKELNKIKKLLISQRFLGNDKTVISFDVSPNPFVLKAKILGDILDKTAVWNDAVQAECLQNVKDRLETYAKMNISEETKKNILLNISNLESLVECIADYNWNVLIVQKPDDEREIKVFKAFDMNEWNQDLNDIWNKMEKVYSPKLKEALVKWLDTISEADSDKISDNINFYFILYLVSKFFIYMNSNFYDEWTYDNNGKDKSAKEIAYKFFKEKLFEKANKMLNGKLSFYELNIFIEDALKQYGKLFDTSDSSFVNLDCDEYYEQYESSNRVYSAVERYVDREGDINLDGNNVLDYYSDIDVFIYLSDLSRISYNVVKEFRRD